VFYKTAYIDACTTHYTKPVYTADFLKMNFFGFETRIRHKKIKN